MPERLEDMVEPEPEWVTQDVAPRSLEEGEEIIGRFRGTRPGKFGDIYMFDKPDGTLYNIYGGVQFEGIVTQANIGRLFRIKYLGKEDTSRGYTVKLYDIAIAKE